MRNDRSYGNGNCRIFNNNLSYELAGSIILLLEMILTARIRGREIVGIGKESLLLSTNRHRKNHYVTSLIFSSL